MPRPLITFCCTVARNGDRNPQVSVASVRDWTDGVAVARVGFARSQIKIPKDSRAITVKSPRRIHVASHGGATLSFAAHKRSVLQTLLGSFTTKDTPAAAGA